MRIRLDRQSKRPSQAEVRQLNVLPLRVDEQILRLQISVENSMLMQVNQRLQYLIEKQLGLLFGKRLIALLFHVLFQVVLKVFKDQVKLVLTVNNLLQSINTYTYIQ